MLDLVYYVINGLLWGGVTMEFYKELDQGEDDIAVPVIGAIICSGMFIWSLAHIL